MKVRIVKRVMPSGITEFTIQQRHFLFWWLWVDAWVNKGAECTDTFDSLEDAKRNLCFFDGTKCKEDVVYQ
jgi:hypothetical protein